MSNTPNKLQVLFTILNVQAVLYGVHERNTIRYLVAFESRRAAAIAVAAALPPPCRRLAARRCRSFAVEADFELLSYCFHGMFAALLSKPIRRTRDVGIED